MRRQRVYTEFDDGDGNLDTKSYVVPIATTGMVTVTATPEAFVPEDKMPSSCWSYTGGTAVGLGKYQRSVSKTTAGLTTFTCTCGSSSKTVRLYVYEVTDISVSGATAVAGSNPETFIVSYDPCTDSNTADDYVVLTAVINPVLDSSVVTLNWSGGQATDPADSLKRRVKRNQAALTDVSISGPGSISVPVHRIAVVKVNLNISGVSDSEEDTVAATIYPNTDDDNNSVNPNATPPFDGSDLNETPVTGENDLVSISLSVEPAGALGTVQLDMSGAGKLAVYRNNDKSGNLPGGLTWNLASETLPTSLYIEGRDVSVALADQLIKLTYNWGISLDDTVKATVHTRTGSSSASIAIHNILKDGGIEKIGTTVSGTIGGRKYLVLSVSIGGGEKLISSGDAVVEVREDTTLHDTTDAYIEKSFNLGGTGWEQGFVVGSSTVWKPCSFSPISTDADNKKGSMPIRLRKGEIWNTAEEPDQSDSTYPCAMSHNGSYDVSLTKVNSVAQTSLNFSHYTVPDGWQNPYASEVSALSQELNNLVITKTSVSTNATIDYIKYDPNGSTDRANPQVSFSIVDVDPHYYDIYVWLRSTGQGDWNYTGDYHLLKENEQGSSFSLNFDDDLVIPGLLEPLEKGTLTFDIDVYEYETSTATESMDWNGLKAPYCMSLSQHNVFVPDVDPDTEDPVVVRCNYTLQDAFDNNASEVSLIPLDQDLEERTFEETESIGSEVDTFYNGADGNGLRAYSAYYDDDIVAYMQDCKDWRVIFTAVEDEDCWKPYRRDHESNRMLAENKVYFLGTDLTDAEVDLVEDHPVWAWTTKGLADKALKAAEARASDTKKNTWKTRPDAFRHSYWNILMAKECSPTWAEQYAFAHESENNPNDLDCRMDLHNNRVGREIYAAHPTWTEAQFIANLEDATLYVRVTTMGEMDAAANEHKLVYLDESNSTLNP